MAAEGRQVDPGVAATLFQRPYAFDFYQAVRLLYWIHERTPPAERPPEVVRFAARLALEAPASEIYELEPGKPAHGETPATPPEMIVNFIGLTGPSGVLPLHYTELLLERRFRHRDRTLQRFLDIFNHRLTVLFYRAWAKYHIFIDYESAAREGFTRQLLDLMGLGTEGLRDRLARTNLGVTDRALVYYAGILAQRPNSAAGLEAIVSDFFRVPVRVSQFIGRWQRVPEDQCTQLGVAETALGGGAMLGAAFWDAQSKFRIRLGPLTHGEFRRFMPNARGFVALARFGNFYGGTSLDFDVQLAIKRAEVPWCVLGGRGEFAAYLGWSTWFKSFAPGPDPDDAVFPVGKARRWRPTEARVYGEDIAPELARHWRPPEADNIVTR